MQSAFAGDTPLVSVLLSCHNAEATLADAIQSVLWQSYDKWELILIDDGSTDRTLEIARQIRDSRIVVIAENECRGLAVRLNQGIARARGSLIARMDADDTAFPDRFMKQVAFLQERPDISLLATGVLLVDAAACPVGVLTAPPNHAEICARPWAGFPMPHPTWMGRADWFRRFQYDVRAKKAQDQEMLLRSYRSSRFAVLPDVLLAYRYDRISVRKSVLGRWVFVRSAIAGSSPRHAAATIANHAIAAGRDLMAVIARNEQGVIRRRTMPVSAELRTYWNKLRSSLVEGSAMAPGACCNQ
jgi:glycosyltransferase involved in cell wall biosynthesis